MIFLRYTPWNIPKQFSHIFDLIYVRVARAREIAAFYRYSRQNGLYIQIVRSYIKRVYVFFALVLSTKVLVYVYHDRLAVFIKLSNGSDHSSFLEHSDEKGTKKHEKTMDTYLKEKLHFHRWGRWKCSDAYAYTYLKIDMCKLCWAILAERPKSTKHVKYRVKPWL